MPTQKFEFPGSQDHPLAGRLDTPEAPPRAYALFAHCFTCGKDIAAAGRIARALATHGIAVVRFDFTGLGGSGGDFANTHFSSNIDDLVAAAAHMRATLKAPSILIGHSLGGAAVLAAAERLPEVKAVVSIAAPFEPGHVKHLFAGQLDEINAEGEAEVSLAGRPFRIQKAFLDDINCQAQAERIANLGKALLVMHAPTDQLVGVDNARRIFQAAKHPKSFVSLDSADHLLSRQADAEYAACVLAAWVTRYAGVGDAHPPPPDGVRTEEGEVAVWETGNGTFQQIVAVGPHRLFADEPRSVGGDATGPTPYDLLLAGLGACTAMTIRMYVARKGWPLEHVSVRLTHSRVHAKDCGDCESAEGQVDVIDRVVTLLGELDATQRASIMRIADRCPVHRTLHNEIKVRTRAGV